VSKMDEPDLSAPWRPAKNDARAYNEGVREGCRVSARRIEEMEDDLTITRLQLSRIADEVFDPAMDEDAMRLAIMNIRYIINPAT